MNADVLSASAVIMRRRRYSGGVAIALLLLAAPALAFPLQMPVPAGLAVAVLIGFLCWDVVRCGWWPWPRAFTASIAALALMIVSGTLRSPAPDLTAPKVCSLVLGLAVLVVLARHLASRRAVYVATVAYMLVGALLVWVGSLAAAWQWKFAGIGRFAHTLPRGFENLPGTDGSVNTNALAATILLVMPVVGAALWGLWQVEVSRRVRRQAASVLWVLRIGGSLAVLSGAGVLLLTQSRSAWLALAATAGILLSLTSHLMLRLMASAALLVLLAGAVIGIDRMTAGLGLTLRHVGIAGEHFKFEPGQRMRIWSLAIAELRAAPLLGVGLGAFRRIVAPRISATSNTAPIVHAHNTFVQTALDVGLVGLGAYAVLIGVTLWMAWRTYVAGDPILRWLAAGFGANVLAVHLFGLVDAVALGAKIGLLQWISIGLVAAMYRLRGSSPPALP